MPVNEPPAAAESPSGESPDASSESPDASSDGALPTADAGRRRHLPLSLIGWGVLAVVAVGVAWVVVTGLIARSELNDARAQIQQLRRAVVSGDLDRSEKLVSAIRDSTDRAASLTSGPAWWVSSHLPVVGAPLYTGREIATQSARLGDDVLPGVLRLARTLANQTGSPKTDSVDLGAVADAAPVLHSAATTATSAYDTLRSTDGSWLPFVASARDSFVTQLRRLDGELAGADRAARILLPMLGRDGLQRYYIGFLNEAESRGGGGIPGAFAIATADHGRISFEHFGTDSDFPGITSGVDLGPELNARYGNNDPTGILPNSNLSPDFSVPARIWAGFWEKKTGERIDGAIALDPTAISYLLKVTGPARLADGTTVSSSDIVALTQKTQYARFTGRSKQDTELRKQFLTSVARAVSQRLTSGGGSAPQLVRAMSRAAGERRVVVWSRTASVEDDLRTAGWAGELGNDRGTPYSGFVVNNAAGSKLDYYLDRTMTYSRTACGAGGTAVATIALTNDAPRSGLPAYVTFRADTLPAGAKAGDNRLLVTYYASRDAKVTSMTVDGQTVPITAQPEGNTLAVTATVELPVQTTATVRVMVTEPAADGPVDVLRQPLVQPLVVDLRGDRCR